MSVKDSPVKGSPVKGSTVKGTVKSRGAGPKARYRADRKAAAAVDSRAVGLGTGWTVFSYLIGGMVAYGAIGWLIGRAVHVSLLFPVGMLVGLGISLGYIIYRFGKQQGAEAPPARKEMTGDR